MSPSHWSRLFRGTALCVLGFTVILLELCGSHLLRVEVADASPTCFQNPTAASGAAEQETIVDKTPDELVRALPELAGLEPAQGQEILPVVLKKVGENVEAYFRNFLSTTALEETVQQRLRLDGNVEETFRQEYRYLVVTHPGNGPMDWDEYRADKEGRPVGTTAQGGALLTARFFYVPIYLHSQYQEDSDFSYLGQQNVDGHKCHVIAFAQSPDTARLKVTLTEGLVSYKVFLQGLAWIDATSYQIIRMYTELLPDLSVRAIKKQTTEVTFGEVHFKRIDVSFWLPREVVVNTDWSGRKFRNYHRYSGYQLYSSETKLIY